MKLLFLVLVACSARPDVVRKVDPIPDVPAPEAAPAPPFVAPLTWNQGRADETLMRRTPVERWSTVLGGPVAAPIVTDGTHFFAIAGNRIRCLDDWGKSCWDLKNDPIGARFGRGELVVNTRAGALERIHPVAGTVIERLQAPGPGSGLPVETPSGWRWVAGGALQGGAAPITVGTAVGNLAADGERVFVAVTEGRVLAVEGGAVVWDTSLGRPPIGGVTLSETRIYVPIASVGGQPGGLVALNRDGQELWRTPTDQEPAAAASVVGNLLVFADRDGYVYGLNADTGEVRWKVEGFSGFVSQPYWFGSGAWVGNDDGKLYRIDMDDGTVATTISLGASVTGAPVVSKGIFVVGLANGRVVGLVDGG